MYACFFTSFLSISGYFQYLIWGWSTLTLTPSYVVVRLGAAYGNYNSRSIIVPTCQFGGSLCVFFAPHEKRVLNEYTKKKANEAAHINSADFLPRKLHDCLEVSNSRNMLHVESIRCPIVANCVISYTYK